MIVNIIIYIIIYASTSTFTPFPTFIMRENFRLSHIISMKIFNLKVVGRFRLGKLFNLNFFNYNTSDVSCQDLLVDFQFFCANPSVSQQDARKNHTRKRVWFWLKSGGYLSSQRLTVSTFGVKELNFCVRNGNRWILFAIVTAIVIYSAFTVHIRLYLNLSLRED